MAADDLESLRAAVDEADRAIVVHLARRWSAVEALGRHKREAGLPATDDAREQQLRARWTTEAVAQGLPPEVAIDVLDAVLTASRRRVATIVTGDFPPESV